MIATQWPDPLFHRVVIPLVYVAAQWPTPLFQKEVAAEQGPAPLFQNNVITEQGPDPLILREAIPLRNNEWIFQSPGSSSL